MSQSFWEAIADELERREQAQRELHGKSDDEHGDFARFLLELFDKRGEIEAMVMRHRSHS